MNKLKNELYNLIKKDFSIFEYIHDNMLDGLWCRDLDGDKNEWISERWWQLLGYDIKNSKHTELKWQNLVHPDDLNIMNQNLEKHLLNPEYPFDQIIRFIHKNKSTVWVRCRGIAVRDILGKSYKILGIHQDITQLKQQEIKISEQKKQFEIALNNLKQVSEKDSLTNLHNRRYFDKKLKYFVKSAVRYNLPISLIVLDLDRFKQHNDSYGHPEGDRLLISVGQILRENGRDSDIVCRIGGEEFALLLTNTGRDVSKNVCERLKQSFDKFNWPNESLSASFGIASIHIKLEGEVSNLLWGELYRHADKALYFSKESGRNRYHHYDDIRTCLSQANIISKEDS